VADASSISFGIKTTPLGVEYGQLRQLWQEADDAPEIEHAWLWDHLQPMRGDLSAPVLEGWTLLAALAGQTQRVRLGVLVTNNLIRPPAVLAKIAATTDAICNGRLVLGLGAGGNLGPESRAYGLPEPTAGHRIEQLSESCTIIKRLWTEPGPLDHRGRYYTLSGARCAPRPVQTPHPPLLIGGVGERRLLRVVAEHADIWNAPGPPYLTVAEFRRKNHVLDQHCRAIGRDHREIARSVQLTADPDNAGETRALIAELVGAGAQHIILALPSPYGSGLIDRLLQTIIGPARDAITYDRGRTFSR
jgi:alkanesulfonate monooxygenase SsuD/methylene tetrahydromethanopterin reductase-like flavin-dependent oxidoreductase (luciferase family)